MTHAVRLQLSRKKGFDLQTLSLQTNGLPAKAVTRPSRWGNPFVVGMSCAAITAAANDRGVNASCNLPDVETVPLTRLAAASLFDQWLSQMCQRDADAVRAWLAPLAGHNLACFCPPQRDYTIFCHADSLVGWVRVLCKQKGACA